MKAFSLYTFFNVIFLMTLSLLSSDSYGENTGIEDVVITTFLDWAESDTVPLYNKPGGTIQKNLLCTNYNKDEITMIEILSVNDSMYRVSAYSGDNDSIIGIGWIYKSAPIRVVARLYTPKENLLLNNDPNGRDSILSLTIDQLPVSGLLNVVDVNTGNGWIKIIINADSNVVEGWIPPNSYCGNPYTTCG